MAIREGQAVMVYPEGTITPVLPIAVLGSHQVWQRGGLKSLAFGRRSG
jgi:hypothetical protein